MSGRIALVLVAAALVLTLAARAVLAVPTGRTVAGSGLARDALVRADVRGELAAEALLTRSGKHAATVTEAARRREHAEAALAGVSDGDGAGALRSRAATLLALLLVDDARQNRDRAPALVRAATERLRDAVRLDRANEAAALDLELLLGRTGRQQSTTSPAPGRSVPQQSGHGGGSSPPGSGY